MKVSSHPLLDYFLLVLYSVFSAVILIVGDSPMVAVTLVLFGAPLLLMWQKVDLKTRFLIPVSFMAIAGTGLVQFFAYKQGIWYEIAPSATNLFGTGPIESYLFYCVMIFYLIITYEYFFDDAKARLRTNAVARQIALIGILLGVSFAYVLLFADVVARNGFAILIGFLFLSLVALFSIRRQLLSETVVKKSVLFSISVLPIALISEFVLLSNNIRFFANGNEYIHMLNFWNYQVPAEELALLILLPMWLVVIYELCFDDGR